jgi:hypothetical protein
VTVGVAGGASAALTSEEALDDAVFEGVEGEDGEPAVGSEPLDRRGEQALELPEFVVHRDADRLKAARGRMDLPVRLARDGTPDGLGEAEGVFPRASAHDGGRHTASESLLSILGQAPLE